MNNLVEQFKTALQETEEKREAAPVAGLFGEGASLTNLGSDRGHDAHAFWQTYVEQFGRIRSTFTHETISARSAALEWESRGELASGEPIEYRGVSVIEWNGDRLTAFRTYYDSAVFVPKAG